MTDEDRRAGVPDRRGPVVIERGADQNSPRTPVSEPPVPDSGLAADAGAPRGRAMQHAALLAARPRSGLGRFFWWALGSLIGFAVSLAAWDFVTGLLARSPVLGAVATALVAAVVLALLGLALRELSALARLRRIDGLRRVFEHALATDLLRDARAAADRLAGFYASRDELEWGRARLAERRGDVFDAQGLLHLAEAELVVPLDQAARREVEAAARQVAAVTAVVPLALADVFTALTANLRMIRRIAEIYGGRAGTLGSWRLTRAVMTHLVATGAVAVGDDLLGSVAGGGLLSKLSRRFGEGVVNGALTARVGIAAIEVCRPMPFMAARRPSVANVVQRSLTGLFGNPD